MDFGGYYDLNNFKGWITKEREVIERTRQHEGAHHWIGERREAEFVNAAVNPGGVSRVFLRQMKSLQIAYDIGVAGLLGEVIAIQRQTNPECDIDLDRLPVLARYIYMEFRERDPNPESNEFIEPVVPHTCDFPSTMWGQLSVADLVRPIEQGLEEGRLVRALTEVSRLFNDRGSWEEFQGFIDAHPELYPKARA